MWKGSCGAGRNQSRKPHGMYHDRCRTVHIATEPCPLTEAQKKLKASHGDPLDFERAVMNAIGEISPAEAEAAISDYRAMWDAARTEAL